MTKEILPETKNKFLKFISDRSELVPKSRAVQLAGISFSTLNRLIEEFEKKGLIEVKRIERFTFIGPKRFKGGKEDGRRI